MPQECPDDDVLAQFVGRTLDERERVGIEEHCEGCESCRALVNHLVEAFAESLEGPWEPTEVLPTPGTTLGRYVILEWVGAGAMGAVYSAYDPQLEGGRRTPSKGGGDQGKAGRWRTLRLEANLANVLFVQKRFEGARSAYRAVIEKLENVLPSGHPVVAHITISLVAVELELDPKLDDAPETKRALLEIVRRCEQEPDALPDACASALFMLARSLVDDGNGGAAERWRIAGDGSSDRVGLRPSSLRSLLDWKRSSARCRAQPPVLEANRRSTESSS